MKEKKERVVVFRITGTLKEEIEKEANDMGLTVSGYVRYLLIKRKKDNKGR